MLSAIQLKLVITRADFFFCELAAIMLISHQLTQAATQGTLSLSYPTTIAHSVFLLSAANVINIKLKVLFPKKSHVFFNAHTVELNLAPVFDPQPIQTHIAIAA